MVNRKSGVPRGYQAVMPYLTVHDAVAAIRFYKKAFGAKESYRLKQGGKIGHAELDIGGAIVMIADDMTADGEAKAGKVARMHLAAYVEDADKTMAKAVKAGAKVRQAAADQFFGDRMGLIEDPFGHVWSIHTRIEKVAPRDMQKRLNAMLRAAAASETPAKPARKAAKRTPPAKTARRTAAKAATVRRQLERRGASARRGRRTTGRG